MRIKMITGVFYEGADLLPGESYLVSDTFGLQLINQGRAREVSPPEQAESHAAGNLASKVFDEAPVAVVAPAQARNRPRRG